MLFLCKHYSIKSRRCQSVHWFQNKGNEKKICFLDTAGARTPGECLQSREFVLLCYAGRHVHQDSMGETTHNYKRMPEWFLLFLFLFHICELDNVGNLAIQHFAHAVQCIQSDAFILPQWIKCSGTDFVTVNKLILAYAFLPECFPQWPVADNSNHVLFFMLLYAPHYK